MRLPFITEFTESCIKMWPYFVRELQTNTCMNVKGFLFPDAAITETQMADHFKVIIGFCTMVGAKSYNNLCLSICISLM